VQHKFLIFTFLTILVITAILVILAVLVILWFLQVSPKYQHKFSAGRKSLFHFSVKISL